MTREELQHSIIKLIPNKRRIILQWCTGAGKSKMAIDIANKLTTNNSALRVLLVVAEIAHKSNWNDEFNKWGIIFKDITIECYASLKKYKDTNWDLIIFDEAHHLNSDLRIEILNSIEATNILLLSATLPDNIIDNVSKIFGNFYISKVLLPQAIEWGLLPSPTIHLIPLTLDNTINNCTIIEEWGKKHNRVICKCKFQERWLYMKNRTKYPNITLEIACTQLQKYNYLSDQLNYYQRLFFNTHGNNKERVKNKWLQIGSRRKRFLGECKTNIAKELISKVGDKRFICFCSSVEQCNNLGGKNTIHSKKTNSLEIIDNFNNKKIDNLFAVNMLQEGQNLTDIEIGIIIQLDGQERAFIQKFGRGLRAKDPIQFIFYYKNTRDEEYLDNIIKDIDKQYISVLNNILDLKI